MESSSGECPTHVNFFFIILEVFWNHGKCMDLLKVYDFILRISKSILRDK